MADKNLATMIRLPGTIAAYFVASLILAYLFTGVVWLMFDSGPEMFALQPSEPYLYILELLIFFSVPALLLLVVSIHILAPSDKKLFSTLAIVFMSIMGLLTSSVHFVQLTAVRQALPAKLPGSEFYLPNGQLSTMLALDMLAWTFFYGLANIFGALVFSGDRLQRSIRAVMFLSGLFCVAGISGPLSGDLQFYLSAPLGFTVGTFATCILLAKWFRRQ